MQKRNNSLYYVVIHGDSDNEKHKYVAKIDLKKYTRYFYNLKAYRAYLNKKKSKTEEVAKKTNNSTGNTADTVKKYISSVSKKVVSELEEPSEKVKAFINKVIGSKKDERVPGVQHKYEAKEKLPNGKYRYFYSEKEHKVWLDKQKYLVDEPEFMKDIPKTKDMVSSDSPVAMSADNCKAVNNNWHDSEYTTNNCFFCTTAYELRQRGYDVVARQTDTGTLGIEAHNIFENPKINTFTKDVENNPEELKRQLIELSGAGSRGNICIRMKPFGGHSMAYEISPDGKEVVIVDAQTNECFNLAYIAELINTKPASTGKKEDNSMFFRTDNLKLKDAVLNLVQPASENPEVVIGEEDLVSERRSLDISDYGELIKDEDAKQMFDELFDEDGKPKKTRRVFNETDFPEAVIKVTWR